MPEDREGSGLRLRVQELDGLLLSACSPPVEHDTTLILVHLPAVHHGMLTIIASK